MFQKTMDTLLQGIPDVICYIDDILVTGTSEEEHLQNITKVLDKFKEYGVRVKQDKCKFMSASVKYLGHRIDPDGIHAMDSELEAIREAPTPQNIQELYSFLGLLNYYASFIPKLSSLIHPLNRLLHHDTRWKWTKDCKWLSMKPKQDCYHPTCWYIMIDPTLPVRMAGDASPYGIGAVLSHVMQNGVEQPIAFASRTLSTSESNYAQLEKEALALIFGVRKFHMYLYGHPFTLVTDKPLQCILGPKKGIPLLAAARLHRWAIILASYQYDIEFKPTKAHANTDGLTRLPLSTTTTISLSDPEIFNISQIEALPVTGVQLQAATRTDPVLSKVFCYTRDGWPS